MRSILKKITHRKSRRSGPPQAWDSELLEGRLAIRSNHQPIGGDCHLFLRVSPTRVAFAIFDVAGRWPENQKVVDAVQSAFRSSAYAFFNRDELNEADAMVEICHELNRTILKASDHVRVCPAFVGCFNESLGTVSYFNAGHMPGLLLHEGELTELKATGLPLGLFSHSTPDASMVALPHGAALLLVSRGLVEAKRKRKEFGFEQVRASLLSNEKDTADRICSGLLEEVQQFVGNRPIENDVTILALARSRRARAAAG